MHDAKGRELMVGDTVLIPCKVTDVQPRQDYCNCHLETLGGRPPDGQKEHFGAVNTQQMIRANEGDDTTFATIQDNGKTFLR